jgi:DNA-binding winged helix-turn-helix (wHTH) protein
MTPQGTHRYAFGSFRIDPSERVLRNNGVIVPLTPKVFQTLLVLVESAGRVVQKEEFLDRIWPGVFVEESNLNVNVSILRRALGDDSRTRRYIETVPKRGYRFVASVQEFQLTHVELGKGLANSHLQEGGDIQFVRGELQMTGSIEEEKTSRLVLAFQSSQPPSCPPFLSRLKRPAIEMLLSVLVLLALGVFVLHC